MNAPQLPDPVPIAAHLGLRCPDCNTQLEDAIGPFWCPGCEATVSAIRVLASVLGSVAKYLDGLGL